MGSVVSKGLHYQLGNKVNWNSFKNKRSHANTRVQCTDLTGSCYCSNVIYAISNRSLGLLCYLDQNKRGNILLKVWVC